MPILIKGNGGGVTKLQEKTISPMTVSQKVLPDSGYDGLSQVNVEAMPTVSKATPAITVSSSGLITTEYNQSEGYVTSGKASATKQLPTFSATTIIPTTENQLIAGRGVYTTGNIYVYGDSNLKAENIKKGVVIFNTVGSYSGDSQQNGYYVEIKSDTQQISVSTQQFDVSLGYPQQVIITAKVFMLNSSQLSLLAGNYTTTLGDNEIPVGGVIYTGHSFFTQKTEASGSTSVELQLAIEDGTMTFLLSNSYCFGTTTYGICLLY